MMTVWFVLLPGLMTLPVSAQVRGHWTPVGTGDCSGNDLANSRTGTPDPARCTVSSGVKTAVCWDNVCTYKSTPTASCTGGRNPGRMYRCDTSDEPPPTSPWRHVGTGDCPGADISNSRSPLPEAAMCGPSSRARTAVCWDSGCTYKTTATTSCTGGRNPGRMYTCASSPDPPPQTRLSLTGAWVHSGDPNAPTTAPVILIQDGQQVTMTQCWRHAGKWMTIVCRGPLSGRSLRMQCEYAPGGNPFGFASGTIALTLSEDGSALDGFDLPTTGGRQEAHYRRRP